jgi:hypothetical protein
MRHRTQAIMWARACHLGVPFDWMNSAKVTNDIFIYM